MKKVGSIEFYCVHFEVGLLWLILGITQNAIAFYILAGVHIVIGFIRLIGKDEG